MIDLVGDTTVRIPRALSNRFERLKKRSSWMSFADFVREAVRKELAQQERVEAAE